MRRQNEILQNAQLSLEKAEKAETAKKGLWNSLWDGVTPIISISTLNVNSVNKHTIQKTDCQVRFLKVIFMASSRNSH